MKSYGLRQCYPELNGYWPNFIDRIIYDWCWIRKDLLPEDNSLATSTKHVAAVFLDRLYTVYLENLYNTVHTYTTPP